MAVIKTESQLDRFLDALTTSVRSGLRHGFFKLRVTGKITKGNKREVVVEAGNTYKFTIPPDEISR